VINPPSDVRFADRAASLLPDHVRTPEGLETELRKDYPRAVVHKRVLTGEPDTWYVYREGRWIPSSSETTETPSRATLEPLPITWPQQRSGLKRSRV